MCGFLRHSNNLRNQWANMDEALGHQAIFSILEPTSTETLNLPTEIDLFENGASPISIIELHDSHHEKYGQKNDILISETHAYQWPFQDPKLEVPTIYKAYIRPKFQGISPRNTCF